MLFVPDEDYVRVSGRSTTSAAAAAAAADDDNDGNDGGNDEDKDIEDNPVSPSLLFASQAQYLGHSNQVSINVVATHCRCQRFLIQGSLTMLRVGLSYACLSYK